MIIISNMIITGGPLVPKFLRSNPQTHLQTHQKIVTVKSLVTSLIISHKSTLFV